MVPNAILDRVNEVRNAVTGCRRISVTDLTRGKDWRSMLPEAGIMEVTDRGDTAGWLVSDSDMRAMVEDYNRLEEELERAQIAAMFAEREASHPLTGNDLAAGVRSVFEARKQELMGIVADD